MLCAVYIVLVSRLCDIHTMNNERRGSIRATLDRHVFGSVVGGILIAAATTQGAVSCGEHVSRATSDLQCTGRMTEFSDASSDSTLGALRVTSISSGDCVPVQAFGSNAIIGSLHLNSLFAACRIIHQRGQIGVIDPSLNQSAGFIHVTESLAVTVPKDFPACD